jgi:hypothetical protein
MSAGELRAALAAPLAGYVLFRLLGTPLLWTGPAIVGVAVSLATLVAAGPRRPVFWPFLPWAVAVLGTVGWVAVGGGRAGLPGALAAGLLVGAPAVAFAWLALWRDNLPASIGNWPMFLAVAAFGLAMSRGVAPPASTGGSWVGALAHLVALQAGALSLSTSSGIPSAPLGYAGDAVFDVLGIVAILGLLVTLLLSSERLPRRAASASGAEEVPTRALAWSEATSTFAVHSVPRSAFQVAGVVSLVVALGAVLAFEVAAAVPGLSVLGLLGIAVVLVLFLLGYLGYPTTWERWRTPAPRRTARPRAGRRARAPGRLRSLQRSGSPEP